MSGFSAQWLQWHETQRLMSLFAQSHVEFCFAGDAVRDALLARTPDEVGIITTAPIDYVTTILVAEGIDVQVGKRQVVALLQGKRFVMISIAEMARHEHFMTRVKLYLEQSADFRMNTLCVTTQGALQDFFGGGDDVRAERVTLMREATTFFSEDISHVLRYLHMVAAYGGGEVDAALLALCRSHIPRLYLQHKTARVMTLMAIAVAPHGAKILRLMLREGMLEEVLGFAVSGVQAFEHLHAIEVMLKIKPDKETRLLLFAALASIPVEEALAAVAAPHGWSEAMLEYYGWIAQQMRLRVGIDPQWRATMGDKGFRRLVLGTWALDEEVVEDAAEYYALWHALWAPT